MERIVTERQTRPDEDQDSDSLKEPKRIKFRIPELPELTPEEIAEREARDAEAALTRERAERQGRLAKLFAQAGDRYAACRLSNYEVKGERQQKALEAVREYVSTLPERIADRNGLILYGPAGTGKDHLAFCVAGAAIANHGRSAMYVNGQDWFGELRDGIDQGNSERQAIERLAHANVLILSDPLPPFGNLTQHQGSMLYRLINARYSNGNVTV